MNEMGNECEEAWLRWLKVANPGYPTAEAWYAAWEARGQGLAALERMAVDLMAERDDLIALNGVSNANHGACLERCEQLEAEVAMLRAN